ncbi:MAG: hypothetical protein HKM89_13765 [Gemmatimonadales bacterium]|nr:hypothetical protein [Gemmatimonadales bacterium]
MIRRLAGLIALATAATFGTASAQAGGTPQSSHLSFFGLEAGAHLTDLDDQVRELGGSGLRCTRSRADRRVLDCRGTAPDPSAGQPVEIWVSAIDSLGGVVTISGSVSAGQLDDWRRLIEDHYGKVGARVQGPQWMMQWVRRQQMIRLTWRVENNQKVASVSLVDGPVLDGWQR